MIHVEDIGGVRKYRLARRLLGRSVYFTAAYWVDGLMIDTGCAYTVHELVGALEELRIDRIVNTHSHEDHVAANRILARRPGVEILAHPLALEPMAAPRERQTLKPYQIVMWGYFEPSSGFPIGNWVETANYRFQVLHTPGHSLDHICLYEPERGWLFCGDAYIGGKDRALRADYNVWGIIGSLRKMAELDVGMLFTGSGKVRENGNIDILEKVQYLEEMGERVLDLHQKGHSRRRIRQILFGPEMPIAYFTLGHFSGKQLVRSYIEDRPEDRFQEE